MTERTAGDQDVRDRVSGDLGTTFLVEAGAGTGKTRVLVDRYVRCVLDPERGTRDVGAVAAITFTEKAAGELRQRIREELERRALAAEPGSADAATIQTALDALDDAPIGTIHGFAGRLLREFPVEAGVDPAFEQLDGLGAEIEQARLWLEWLTELAVGNPREVPARAWVSRLLRAGVRLDALRELAVGPNGVFGERYDLDAPEPSAGEPDIAARLDGLTPAIAELREYCDAACTTHNDGGFAAAITLGEELERVRRQPRRGADELAARLFALPLKATPKALGGRRENWPASRGGKDGLWQRYQAVTAGVLAVRDQYAEYITGLAVATLVAFSRWAGAAQVELGRLDFTDLLGRLRDLLARDREARALLQERFRYLLVDEFQDTDPLQAEIVFYLCERAPAASHWHDVVLDPGKLFVVGDPKQSIYRFRRADIGMYDKVKELIAGQPGGRGAVTPISQNFRTTPAIVGWVNAAFADVFDTDQERGRQPGYQAVEPFRRDLEGSRVAVVLGAPAGAGGVDRARRDEASAVAALLRAMRGDDAERWRVRDRLQSGDAGEASGGAAEPARRPRWGDIALLFRATTGLETLEEALRAAGVPYRVDGGKTYFTRREVDDALLCLRAVDDPGDGPALYGALHSTLFGFSDDELFLFWAAGGVVDLFAEPQPAGHEAVAAALRSLRGLHELKAVREPHELVAELVRRTRAAELLAATGPQAPQAIANLEKLIDRARAFAGAGGGGLGAFLTWAAQAGEAAGEQESTVDDDSDVVHLLTIHKAKGLEYPIVLVVGGAFGGSASRSEPMVDRASRRLAVRLRASLPGVGEQMLEPQSYTALSEREKRMGESELRRLLYVAATRARDHFVVTCFGKLTTKEGAPVSGALLGPLAERLPELAAIAAEYEDGGVLVLPPLGPSARGFHDAATTDCAALLAERRVWARRRAELLERAACPAAAVSPSGLEELDEIVRAGGPGAPAGRAKALALGSAVHRIMELCDLADASSVQRLAPAVAAELERPDLADEAAALAGVCWRSAPVRAAARSAEVYREMPIAVLVDGVVVSGAVDVLYDAGDAWIVVDYKTDRTTDPAILAERYAPQAAAYALAVAAATGRPVREVVLVAAASEGLTVNLPVDDHVRERVRHDVEAAVDACRCLVDDGLGEAT